MLVVFDPNVLISALIRPDGVARQVVQRGLQGQFDYAMCPLLIREVEDVSRRPRIARLVPPDAADRFVADIRGRALLEADPETTPVSRDPKDDYLVALAVAIGADLLVSGDKDLLTVPDPPVEIVTVRSFSDLLSQAR